MSLRGRLNKLVKSLGAGPQTAAAVVEEASGRVLQVLRRRVAEPDYIVPEDLAREFGPERAVDALRELIGRFGRLLQIWPAVWQAAKT